MEGESSDGPLRAAQDEDSRMHRYIVLLAAGLAVWVGAAGAQVATTDLTAGAPRIWIRDGVGLNAATITPDNPAALVWSQHPLVSAGVFRVEQTAVASGVTQHLEGAFGGVRGVWDWFAVGAEGWSYHKVSPAPLDFRESDANGQLAARLGEFLSVGVGANAASNGTPGASWRVGGKTAGTTVRLWKVLYVGYAAIREHLNNQPAGPVADRDGLMRGVALRTENAWPWYIAYDVIEKQTYPLPIPGTGQRVANATVQWHPGAWLLGVSRATITNQDGTPLEFKPATYDVGWAPERGLLVTLRHIDGDLAPGSGQPVVLKNRMTSLTVAYRF